METLSATRSRLLFLLPFVPRLDARHGGRTTAGLIARLAERHDAALICLRAPGEGSVDTVIRERCQLVEEVPAGSPSAAWRSARLLWWLAMGQPIEVSDSSSSDFTERVRSVARDWRPDVVHVELERMAYHLDALAAPRRLGCSWPWRPRVERRWMSGERHVALSGS